MAEADSEHSDMTSEASDAEETADRLDAALALVSACLRPALTRSQRRTHFASQIRQLQHRARLAERNMLMELRVQLAEMGPCTGSAFIFREM